VKLWLWSQQKKEEQDRNGDTQYPSFNVSRQLLAWAGPGGGGVAAAVGMRKQAHGLLMRQRKPLMEYIHMYLTGRGTDGERVGILIE